MYARAIGGHNLLGVWAVFPSRIPGLGIEFGVEFTKNQASFALVDDMITRYCFDIIQELTVIFMGIS